MGGEIIQRALIHKGEWRMPEVITKAPGKASFLSPLGKIGKPRM